MSEMVYKWSIYRQSEASIYDSLIFVRTKKRLR